MVIGKSSHASIEMNVGTSEISQDFDVEYVFMLANDGSSDVYVNFDADTTAPGTMTLKPGLPVFNFPRTCKKLYIRSSYDNQPIRAWGVK